MQTAIAVDATTNVHEFKNDIQYEDDLCLVFLLYTRKWSIRVWSFMLSF